MKHAVFTKLQGLRKSTWLGIGFVSVVVLGSALFSVKDFVAAQNAGQGLEVSPPNQEVSIDPGKKTTVKAKIRNTSNKELPMKVRVEDFTARGDQGQIELKSDSPYSVASWTDVSPETFSLGAGEEHEVTATITAPSDAAGGRFGSFVFSVQPGEAGGGAASVSQEIASLFLVRVSGPVDEQLAIKSIKAPAFSEFGPVPLDVTFANTGNVHVKTFGLINVTDMFGNKVADIVVPDTNIFPQADRTIRSELNKQFLFGKYTATALMYYGTQNENLTSTTSFIVFPVRIVGGIIIVLFLLYLMRKRLGKALKALFR